MNSPTIKQIARAMATTRNSGSSAAVALHVNAGFSRSTKGIRSMPLRSRGKVNLWLASASAVSFSSVHRGDAMKSIHVSSSRLCRLRDMSSKRVRSNAPSAICIAMAATWSLGSSTHIDAPSFTWLLKMLNPISRAWSVLPRSHALRKEAMRVSTTTLLCKSSLLASVSQYLLKKACPSGKASRSSRLSMDTLVGAWDGLQAGDPWAVDGVCTMDPLLSVRDTPRGRAGDG
mmetsp:Transcript_8895/g.22361  ORF Transcript_8895/g.22361 Transcript_8895/m.22361 type:complete len:231 (+) Transcript_8895:794-1486(+)